MKNKIFRNFAIALFSLAAISFSMELRPFVQGFLPSDITVSKEQKGVNSEVDYATDYVLEGGVELLFDAEFNPMRYGLGVGYRTALKDDDHEAAPATIPVWAKFAFGRINVDAIASPYMSFRGGTLAPVTKNGNWWELPLNWFAGIGVGSVFPLGIGLEIYADYTSLLKSYEDKNLEIRINSAHVGAQISVGIELVRDRIYKTRSHRSK